MNKEINEEYFDWMYQKVCEGQYSRELSWRKLLRYLHRRQFTYMIGMDANRAEDGRGLRYRFAYETGAPPDELGQRQCSLLEMMVALSIRCEEHIMEDPVFGNRTGKWFWTMIDTAGLSGMNDLDYDVNYVRQVVTRILKREYEPTGEGGLFMVRPYRGDLRDIEIWYQMMWYLSSLAEG